MASVDHKFGISGSHNDNLNMITTCRYESVSDCCLTPTQQFYSYIIARTRFFFRNQPFSNKNCLWRPCLLTDRDEMSNIYREPSIDASYQVSVHLAKRFQRRRLFRNQPIRNNNCLWRPCLLTDREEMSYLYRGPFIDAS
jgi:hypothetical protein